MHKTCKLENLFKKGIILPLREVILPSLRSWTETPGKASLTVPPSCLRSCVGFLFIQVPFSSKLSKSSFRSLA